MDEPMYVRMRADRRMSLSRGEEQFQRQLIELFDAKLASDFNDAGSIPLDVFGN